jgi:hypothetical protein
MRYKEFGKTGKKVSVLGLGAMRFDPSQEATAIETVHAAVEAGINYIDTAPTYCDDKSEEFIGKALHELPAKMKKNILISTKSNIHQDPGADDVRRRIDMQLKRLHRDKIDFYNMWCLMDYEHYLKVMAKNGPFEGAVKAKEEGLVEHLCCTAHASGEDIAGIVEEAPFEGITLGYNIINHSFRKPGLKAAAAAGWGVVTMNPLGGGMLTRDEERLQILTEDESDSFIAAALRFNLAHPEITVVLSGMKNPLEVKENAAAAESMEKPDPAVVHQLQERFEALGESFCTGCRYCLEDCPEDIQIHLYMAMWDQVRMKLPEEAERMYKVYLATEDRWLKGKRTTDCTECGECEVLCTQKLPIRKYLDNIGRFLDEK